jgi:DNA-binding response OmpR family regulator
MYFWSWSGNMNHLDAESIMNCLLIEDDLALGRVLQKIVAVHYPTNWVRRLQDAERFLAETCYDIILLDLGLPDGDGALWLPQLRKVNSEIPVLILTARDAISSRIQGLDSGADDYLIKPFQSEELLARMRALLRRRSGQSARLLQHGDLTYDQHNDQFLLGDIPLILRLKEHNLLLGLITARGRPVYREQLLQRLNGGGQNIESNTLEVHIHALRRLIGRDRIETLRGIGYRLLESA